MSNDKILDNEQGLLDKEEKELINNFLKGIFYIKNKKTLEPSEYYSFCIKHKYGIENNDDTEEPHWFRKDHDTDSYNSNDKYRLCCDYHDSDNQALMNNFLNVLIYSLTHQKFTNIDTIVLSLSTTSLPEQSRMIEQQNMLPPERQRLYEMEIMKCNWKKNCKHYSEKIFTANNNTYQKENQMHVINNIILFITQERPFYDECVDDKFLCDFKKKYFETNLPINLFIITYIALHIFTVDTDRESYDRKAYQNVIHINTIESLLNQTLSWLLPLAEICVDPNIVSNKNCINYPIMYLLLYSVVPVAFSATLLFTTNFVLHASAITISAFANTGLFWGVLGCLSSGLPLIGLIACVCLLALTGAVKGYQKAEQENYYNHLECKFFENAYLCNIKNFKSQQPDSDAFIRNPSKGI